MTKDKTPKSTKPETIDDRELDQVSGGTLSRIRTDGTTEKIPSPQSTVRELDIVALFGFEEPLIGEQGSTVGSLMGLARGGPGLK